MNHAVVLKIVQQRQRCAVGIPAHEHRGALHAMRRIHRDALDEHVERQDARRQTLAEQSASGFPGGHDREEHGANRQREPAAVQDLEGVGREERDFQDHEPTAQQSRLPGAPVPELSRGEVEQDGGDDHRERDRDSVGRRQPAGALKAEHERDTREHQEPVDERQVDLPALVRRRVANLHAREIAELDRLH